MHTPSSPAALQGCWDLAGAGVQADALAVTIELGLFDALAQCHSAASLAHLLQLHPASTAHLLELLWSMGLLARMADGHVPVYQNTALAQRHFETASTTSCAGAWLFRHRALRHFGAQLRLHLTQGPTAAAAPATGSWAAAAEAQIGQEQRAFSAAAALAVMARVPGFRAARRVLDLGGGPGLVALALAEANPQLQAVVFDGPQTCAVAQANIAAAGLQSRVSTHGGDLGTDDIGTGYDLVWCSSVLHFVPDTDAVLRKVWRALRPGGVLVCAHAEIAADPGAAVRVLPFYLPMLVLGRHVPRTGAMAAALGRAGFTAVEDFEAGGFPMTPLQVFVARRPAP